MASRMAQLLDQLASLSTIRIPHIACSIPLKWHSSYATILEDANEWAVSTNLMDKRSALQSMLSLYTLILAPVGEHRQALWFAKWGLALFLLDDPFDQGSTEQSATKHAQLVLHLASGGKLPSEFENVPLLRAFEQIVCEMKSLMPPKVFERCMFQYKRLLDMEIVQRQCYLNLEQVQDLQTYIHSREVRAGLGVFMHCAEMCLGIELDEQDADSPEFHAIMALVSQHTGMVNDILGFRLDFYDKQFLTLPGIVFLTNPRITTIQEAMDEACNLIQAKEREFLALHQQLVSKATKQGNEAMLKLLDVLPCFLSGNLRWHFLTSRYHGLDNPIITGRPFHGMMVLHPERSIFQPYFEEIEEENHQFLKLLMDE